MHRSSFKLAASGTMERASTYRGAPETKDSASDITMVWSGMYVEARQSASAGKLDVWDRWNRSRHGNRVEQYPGIDCLMEHLHKDAACSWAIP